ncbi:alpha/beta fold hydrolase [Sphingomonas sp.]|uniref:alpha/beta fold hydrolase n=1 Tax=Sphingomonas sp. TaxID=28214 RepID=UPI0025EFEF04|nr:alpha/beta fold hydrolase [Sphingomonas sp.]
MRRIWLKRGIVGAIVTAALVALALAAPALHLIDQRSIRTYETARANPDVAAVYISGDMGMRFGIGRKVAPALAKAGLPVVAISSPVNFGTHRTRAQADAIVADSIRVALRLTGAKRIVLIGQSFGSDIVATIAPDIPVVLRPRVAAIVAVVPARTVYFRADPTTITYHGTPDAEPAAALRTLDWAPVICIYGVKETDSLCPLLDPRHARIIGLPGGHFLHNDDRLLVATIAAALNRADPAILRAAPRT